MGKRDSFFGFRDLPEAEREKWIAKAKRLYPNESMVLLEGKAANLWLEDMERQLMVRKRKQMEKKVLVVEDDAPFREFFTDFLIRHGVEAIPVASGLEGIRKFNQLRPDAIFLDIVLPDISGVEVLEHVRKKDTQVKVYVFTVMECIEVKRKCIELGVTKYIVKPVKAEEIIDIIKVIKREEML